MPAVPLPTFVQIEPVGRCNLRCRMCPVQFRPDAATPPALLDFAAFQRLVDGFPALADLHLQGLGEPLMHPRLFDMVRYAAARGIRVSINTNLTLLTESRAEQAASCGLHEISVSIDAATPAVYESIRVGARLWKVRRNLRRLVAARGRRGGGSPHIRIVMVLMRRNLDELNGIVHLAREDGVDDVFVQQLCHDFGESSLPPEYRSMREFVAEEALDERDLGAMHAQFDLARRTAAELGVALRLPRAPARSVQAPRGCDWPARGAYLSYRGEAMPCCMVATPDRACLGNMLEDGVDAVWHGQPYQDFRARLASEQPPEICRSCSLYRGTF